MVPSWSFLWRYSQSQIVVYGTYATLLIPLVAHAIIFARHVWQTPGAGGLPSNLPQIIVQGEWSLFAVLLYFSGLLIFFGRLLTQLVCPHRIQRYPYEDDHFIFVGRIESTKRTLDASDELEADRSRTLSDALAQLLEKEEGSATAVNSAWRQDDTRLVAVRFLIAALYGVGSLGVVAFLTWRASTNLGAVLSVFGG